MKNALKFNPHQSPIPHSSKPYSTHFTCAMQKLQDGRAMDHTPLKREGALFWTSPLASLRAYLFTRASSWRAFHGHNAPIQGSL